MRGNNDIDIVYLVIGVFQRLKGLELRVLFREENPEIVFKGQEAHTGGSGNSQHQSGSYQPPAMFYDPFAEYFFKMIHLINILFSYVRRKLHTVLAGFFFSEAPGRISVSSSY